MASHFICMIASKKVAKDPKMATHLLMVSRMCVLVEALLEWAGAPWGTTVDILFIVARCTEWLVIFNLYFRMVLPTNLIIGWMPCREGVECAIAPRGAKNCKPKGVPHKKLQGFGGQEEEDVLFCFVSNPKHRERSPEHGIKCWVDWTVPLEDIVWKRWRDGFPPWFSMICQISREKS